MAYYISKDRVKQRLESCASFYMSGRTILAKDKAILVSNNRYKHCEQTDTAVFSKTHLLPFLIK